MIRRLSIGQARRIALAAHGFGKRRPDCVPDRRHIAGVIRSLGLLQLDFVNVLIPAHYLVVYSRIGPYDCRRLNRTVYQGSDFIEHWAHEASIVPTEFWPLLKYRRDDYRPWPNSPIMKIKGRKRYLESALEAVQSQGPLTSADLPPMAGPKRQPGVWHRSVPRWALEHHFGTGKVSVLDRMANFQRIYDLPEKIIAEPHLSHDLSREDSQRELLAVAAKACGIATLTDLADYFRMSTRDAAPRINELVEAGVLSRVTVESWNEDVYMHCAARVPRRIEQASLLSPFDPVVWFRPRAERLFGFHYRIEIYVPANKRKWGYYVLPFLLGDRIVARVDLKAERKTGRLLVLAAYPESDVDRALVANALAGELRTLSNWLGLHSIKVARKGAFARQLALSCKRACS